MGPGRGNEYAPAEWRLTITLLPEPLRVLGERRLPSGLLFEEEGRRGDGGQVRPETAVR